MELRKPGSPPDNLTVPSAIEDMKNSTIFRHEDFPRIESPNVDFGRVQKFSAPQCPRHKISPLQIPLTHTAYPKNTPSSAKDQSKCPPVR